MLSFTYRLLVALFAVALIPQVFGHAQLFFTGNFISRASDPTELTQEGLTGILSALLNVKPVDHVDSSVSQQMERVLLPTVFARPEAMFSLQALVAPGDESSKSLLPDDTAHAASLQADTSAASEIVVQALNSVAFRGVSNAALDHRKIGSVPDCSDACMEEVVKCIVTAGLKDVVVHPGIPVSSGRQLLSRFRVWAVEMAALHKATQNLAQTRQQEASSASPLPVLYEATVMSPKLLGEKYGSSHAKTRAASSALMSVVNNLVEMLKGIHSDRMVSHLAILDDAPIGKKGVRATVQWHEQQQRRHLLSSTSGDKSTESSANSWFVQAAAYISALLFLVFAIASCQVLAKMQFKQDSLLYARTKAE
ncbi:hypothetical protein COCOBI_04-5950 [Coccomyxa sp. Obi]|nr:hypothetical protein COCOBI_04-5950 [Coccomyxa sp. Obi]